MADARPHTRGYDQRMSSLAPSFIEAAHRAQRWLRDRPMLMDLGLVMLAAVLGIAELTGEDIPGSRDPDLLAVVLILASASPLIFRRKAPFTSFAVALSLMMVVYVLEYDTYLSSVGLPAVYSLAAHGDPRRRPWIAIIVGIGSLFAVASATLLDQPDGYNYSNAVSMLLFTIVAGISGAVVRNRHEIFLDAEARADHAEADRTAAAERAVTTERLRIAREMHDVVAHGMSVISVQAAAAQETFETQPERTLGLLQNIEATSRESLTEMRRMLGVLRQDTNGDQDSGRRTPQPSLGDLDRIVAACVDAGTPTKLAVSGTPVRLSTGLDLTAFRIVQEALTNVLKHGGGAASARVEINYTPDFLELTIADTGRGSVSKTKTSGNGLVGMRERVDVYGGQLSAGPRRGGGYEVKASLPLNPARDRPRVDSGERGEAHTS